MTTITDFAMTGDTCHPGVAQIMGSLIERLLDLEGEIHPCMAIWRDPFVLLDRTMSHPLSKQGVVYACRGSGCLWYCPDPSHLVPGGCCPFIRRVDMMDRRLGRGTGLGGCLYDSEGPQDDMSFVSFLLFAGRKDG